MIARASAWPGAASVAANRGRYNLDTQKVTVDGPVAVDGPDGYRLATSDVTVDLKQRSWPAAAGVGRMRLGQFQAGRMRPIWRSAP